MEAGEAVSVRLLSSHQCYSLTSPGRELGRKDGSEVDREKPAITPEHKPGDNTETHVSSSTFGLSGLGVLEKPGLLTVYVNTHTHLGVRRLQEEAGETGAVTAQTTEGSRPFHVKDELRHEQLLHFCLQKNVLFGFGFENLIIFPGLLRYS